MTERKVKCCPICGSKSLSSSSRNKTYTCYVCKKIYPKSQAVIKTIDVREPNHYPPLLVAAFEKHRQKKAQEKQSVQGEC